MALPGWSYLSDPLDNQAQGLGGGVGVVRFSTCPSYALVDMYIRNQSAVDHPSRGEAMGRSGMRSLPRAPAPALARRAAA